MAAKRPLDPEKKQRLLNAARREFAARGYELASINTILDDAGFSKGSFYWYFEDKADLAGTILAEEAAASIAPLKALRMPDSIDDFWAELRRISLERLKTLDTDRVRYEAFIRIGSAVLNDPKLYARLSPEFAEGRSIMAGLIERGVALGALRNDLPIGTVMALIESLKATLYKSMYPGDKVPSEAEVESFTDLVLDLAKRVSTR